MLELLRQTTLSEVMLLFVILFIVPMLVILVKRLRRYESLFGQLPGAGGKARAAAKPEPEPARPAAVPDAGAAPDDVFPYVTGEFLSQRERTCLEALREALGDVDVFPKVALWTWIEATDDVPGHSLRLHGKCFDYLVCDRRTGSPLTAVMFERARGEPAGPLDELRKICAAAQANVVVIERRDTYDATQLKAALGIPELEI